MADRDQSHQPTHHAYSVIEREGQDDYWLKLGSVFPHKDGKGFSVLLQAIPFNAKIVCREITGDEPESGNEQTRQAVRQANDRRHGRR